MNIFIPKRNYKTAIEWFIRKIYDQNDNFEIIGNLIKIFSLEKILIIGDLHGDIDALIHIFSQIKIENFLSNKENLLICLGDMIDRGNNGIDIIYTLTSLGIKYPGQVIILRGNHEVSKPYEVFPFDFDKELYLKYGNSSVEILDFTINNFFKRLPIAAYIENGAFFVHGGIPVNIPSLSEIAEADPESNIGYQLRWNDPEEIESYYLSDRGPNIYYFGKRITEEFLSKNKLEMIIRSHQIPGKTGYKLNHNGKVVTIFSAKNIYKLPKASYAIYNLKEKKLEIKTF